MVSTFSFHLESSRGLARAGSITTPHGKIKTPIFMPVGTRASVRSLDSADLAGLQAQIILTNTYHLYLRPGMKTLEELGGVQHLMNWHQPMLTDSGGFQVFSLGAQQKSKGNSSKVVIEEQGVTFRSHLDGSLLKFSPELSIQIQRSIGADIIMSFDECLPDSATDSEMTDSVTRTTRWAKRGKDEWEKHQSLSQYGMYQALFGIVQGSNNAPLRKESLQSLLEIGFDGYALGGETVGYDLLGTQEIMSYLESDFPKDKPRYAMGMGRDPQDIIEAVLLGFDMFDCVGPTRLARNGALFSGELVGLGGGSSVPRFESEFSKARLQIANQRFATDTQPIQAGCDCYTCTNGYSRAYLHHLYKVSELSFYRLASIHNVRVMLRLAESMRDWIHDCPQKKH